MQAAAAASVGGGSVGREWDSWAWPAMRFSTGCARGSRALLFADHGGRIYIAIMKVTLDLPDELAADLLHFESQSASIVAAGLREVNAPVGGRFQGLAQVLEKLAELPSPQEVLELRPTDELQARIEELLAKNRDAGLDAMEEEEWHRYETVEHLVRLAKARALAKLQAA